jgi:hypothetical protein
MDQVAARKSQQARLLIIAFAAGLFQAFGMAEKNLRAFAVNDLRGGEDLQLEELPPARLVEAGGGELLLHLSGWSVQPSARR